MIDFNELMETANRRAALDRLATYFIGDLTVEEAERFSKTMWIIAQSRVDIVRPEDKARCSKTVHFFLMTCQGGSVDRHDPEFDEVRWVSADEAMRCLTFANEVNVLHRALAKLADGAERAT